MKSAILLTNEVNKTTLVKPQGDTLIKDGNF